MKKFLLFASAALLIAGCSKNPTPPAGPDPVDPVLVVDETPIPVDAEGVADRAIAVESNGEWTAAI